MRGPVGWLESVPIGLSKKLVNAWKIRLGFSFLTYFKFAWESDLGFPFFAIRLFAIRRFFSFVVKSISRELQPYGRGFACSCVGARWVVPIGSPSASLKQRKKCSTTSKSDPADSKRGPSDQGRPTCMKPIRRELHFGSWWYRGDFCHSKRQYVPSFRFRNGIFAVRNSDGNFRERFGWFFYLHISCRKVNVKGKS